MYLAETLVGKAVTSPERVAVKLIYGTADDPVALGIARDAQSAGRLNQPHIIPFYGVITDENRLALVMAFAQGGSLGDSLRARDAQGNPLLSLPLGAAIVARLVSQIAGALEAAHAAGIWHGDLKPTNVFVRTSPHGRPLAAVSDFGQAVLVNVASAILAGGASGVSAEQRDWAARQLQFAAPEQLNGVTVGASDQYGLAALAYFLLTGTPPIAGDGARLLQLIKEGMVPPPSERNSGLPPSVDSVLLRALAKDPSQRFASLALFAEALRNALSRVAATEVTDAFALLSGDGEPVAHTGQGWESLAEAARVAPPAAAAYAAPDRKPGRAAAAVVPDTPPIINKRLAIITSVALLLTVLACVLASQTLNATSFLPHITLGNQTPIVDTPVVPTPNATEQAEEKAGLNDLQKVNKQTPLLVDSLTRNNSDWKTDGKTLYFAKDGYHISTCQASTSLCAVDTPGNPNQPNLAIKVDIRFDKSQPGNFGGLRYFVSQGRSGSSENYYCFLISIEGRYAVWEHAGSSTPEWTFISSGYSDSLKTGLHQTNTLEVLAIGSGSRPRAIFFANGTYITQIPLAGSLIPAFGGSGLIVFNDNTEVVFSNLALYNANNVAGS